MTVNERLVNGVARFRASCSPAPASRRPRTGATGRCRQRNVTTSRRSSSALMLAASENSLRPSRDKRWATGGQLPSLIRRPPLEADVVDIVRTVRWLTDVATSVADGRRRGGGRRDGTPVAWTVSQVGSRADAAPGAHQTATAFRRRCPTPARSYLLAGVYGIGWSVERRVRESMTA